LIEPVAIAGTRDWFTDYGRPVQSETASKSKARRLVITKIIERPHSGVRLRTRRVCHWQNGQMVFPWAVSAMLMIEQSFRKILGYRDMWTLEAALGRNQHFLEEQVA
jgi:hypothetical protein